MLWTMGRICAVLASVALAIGMLFFGTYVGPTNAIRKAQAQTTVAKPNIIFVLTDDQSADTLNAMPALQNDLVSQGVQFTNMISTYPLCCPGRATILRGQYPHNTRVFTNDLPRGGWATFAQLGEQDSTMATWLDGAGYQTGLFGKYMNNYTSLDIPPGWDRWYAWNGPMMGWSALNDQGVQRSQIPGAADRNVSTAALKYLGKHLAKPSPVFAWVSFGAEHEPYYHEQADAGLFADASVPRTPSFNEDDVSDKPAGVRDLPPLTDADVAQMDQDYADGLRSLMQVDRFIGDASELLRSKGEMDNTYFVFYTDNGNHFGQHRLPHGKLQPYEEDINFPLIVRGPDIAPGVSNDELVGNHDIAPTLARMGGASFPAFVDGRSFLPLARNPSTTSARTAVLSERKTSTLPTRRWEMLRMPETVYTRYESGEKEYYDLVTDPYQLHNAFGVSDTAYPPPDPTIQAHYEKRLDALYACTGSEGPGSCRRAENAAPLPASTVH